MNPKGPDRGSLHRALALLLSATLLGGCMTARVEGSKDAATGIAEGQSIVIIETSYHAGNQTEDGFVDCVTKEVQKGRGGLDVYPDEVFQDDLFPWFEPRTMPQGPNALPALMEKPGVADRIRESGVRYIVWINGNTERTNGGGSLSCAVGPGGGGCYGLAWWENDSSYEAAVWDVEDGKSAGEVSAAVRGTSMIPAVVVPVPLIARTQNAACKGLAKELRSFIVSDDTT